MAANELIVRSFREFYDEDDEDETSMPDAIEYRLPAEKLLADATSPSPWLAQFIGRSNEEAEPP